MISRRKILSRPRDEALYGYNSHYVVGHNSADDEEDVWYSKDKLLKDHILEIYNKWSNIDDEIWAKIIVLERNRRLAKAYARAPILSINGSTKEFDGYHIGLNGFTNPMRDSKTEMIKQTIGDGVKIRMDSSGNILIKKLSKSSPVYIQGWQQREEGKTRPSKDAHLQHTMLETSKTTCLFDMNKFRADFDQELRRTYPDRSKLERMCICHIAFGKDEPDPLELPIWIMVINIVAMEMVKLKCQVVPRQQSVPNIVLSFEQQKSSAQRDENLYSFLGSNGNSSSSESHNSGHYVGGQQQQQHYSSHKAEFYYDRHFPRGRSAELKPPKLPPRHFESKPKGKQNSKNLKSNVAQSEPTLLNSSNKYLNDDPYYCGFSARVPNYAQQQQHQQHQQSQRAKAGGEANNMMAHNAASGLNSRKVSSKGFLNAILKSKQDHSPGSYNNNNNNNNNKTNYVGFVESDPYSLDEDSLVNYAVQSTYGAIGRENEYERFSRCRRKSRIPNWAYRSRDQHSWEAL